MIRPAVPQDLQRLVEMGYAYFVDAGWEKHASFDIESFAFTCGVLIDGGVLLVGERNAHVVGVIGSGVAPFPWNRSLATAQGILFHCDPGHKKLATQLLAEHDAALRLRGVRIASMSWEDGRREKVNLGLIYAHTGYVPVERTYWKAL